MAILDIQIVASSLNELQAGMSASAAEIAWVQTSYLIAEVIAIPLSGYLSRMMSTRVYFVISAVGFALASLMCALAWSLPSLLVFRTLQGCLGGGMIPTTMAALFVLFPPEKRMGPIVLVSMASTLAPAVGPSLGGFLTNYFSWHWMFLINLPPALLISSVVWSYLDHIDKPDWRLWRIIDWTGLASMALFLGCLEFALDEGPRHDWFADRAVLLAVVLGAVFGLVHGLLITKGRIEPFIVTLGTLGIFRAYLTYFSNGGPSRWRTTCRTSTARCTTPTCWVCPSPCGSSCWWLSSAA